MGHTQQEAVAVIHKTGAGRGACVQRGSSQGGRTDNGRCEPDDGPIHRHGLVHSTQERLWKRRYAGVCMSVSERATKQWLHRELHQSIGNVGNAQTTAR